MDITWKETAIQHEFERLLPGIILLPLRVGNENGVNSSGYSISPENRNLRNSQYFYKGEPKFVHFTSLQALEGIIANKAIRLYNLNNLVDPREYSFAGNLITFNSERREDAKRNMHLISMCKESILVGPTQYEFNMWRLYGQNGNGVCIQFDFSKNPLINWRDYFLSEVFYGASNRKNLNDLNTLLIKYRDEKPEIQIDLGQIVAFHKSNLYKLEREVRLLFDCRAKKVFSARTHSDSNWRLLSPLIQTDISKSGPNRKVRYLNLPIYHDKIVQISEDIPVPMINKVILGYSYKEDFSNVSKNIIASIEKIFESW